MAPLIAVLFVALVSLFGLGLMKLADPGVATKVCQWCGNDFPAEQVSMLDFTYSVSRGSLPFIFQETMDRWAGTKVPMVVFWIDPDYKGTERRLITHRINVCQTDEHQLRVWMSSWAGRMGGEPSDIPLAL